MHVIVTKTTYVFEAFEGWPLIDNADDVEMINHFIVEVYVKPSYEVARHYIMTDIDQSYPWVSQDTAASHLDTQGMIEVGNDVTQTRWDITLLTTDVVIQTQ